MHTGEVLGMADEADSKMKLYVIDIYKAIIGCEIEHFLLGKCPAFRFAIQFDEDWKVVAVKRVFSDFPSESAN